MGVDQDVVWEGKLVACVGPRNLVLDGVQIPHGKGGSFTGGGCLGSNQDECKVGCNYKGVCSENVVLCHIIVDTCRKFSVKSFIS